VGEQFEFLFGIPWLGKRERAANHALAGGRRDLDRDPPRPRVPARGALGAGRRVRFLVEETPLEHVAGVQHGARVVEQRAPATKECTGSERSPHVLAHAV